jgi:hypothetical protein
MARKPIHPFWRGRIGPSLVTLAVLGLPLPPALAASQDWAGRWEGTVAVETGPNAGQRLSCVFVLTEQQGATFQGTVTCPGLAPVRISGSGQPQATGSFSGGGRFRGARDGGGASGTWELPEQEAAGTWSLARPKPKARSPSLGPG